MMKTKAEQKRKDQRALLNTCKSKNATPDQKSLLALYQKEGRGLKKNKIKYKKNKKN
jgi:hypothetical protein